jgi:hypothetical protein
MCGRVFFKSLQGFGSGLICICYRQLVPGAIVKLQDAAGSMCNWLAKCALGFVLSAAASSAAV